MGRRLVSRRDFLEKAGVCGLLAGGAWLASAPLAGWLERLLAAPGAAPAAAGTLTGTSLEELLRTAPVARYWASTAQTGTACATCHEGGVAADRPHRHGKPLVECLLCARGCALAEGARGDCGARLNRDGKLRSLVYGRPVAVHVDPIEKKPFYHFLPGSLAYSLATAGCPLHCRFCQNWEISQSKPEDHDAAFVSPAAVVAGATGRGAPVIAFTYNEPTVFIEYLTDIARAGRPRGLRHVLVSCGFMRAAPLAEMCEVLDAVKIDLKGFSDAFYRQVSRAELAPVLRSIRQVRDSGRHLELVNLVVPTLNDDAGMLRGLCEWVAGELGPDVPLHFTRFHPDYQLLNLPPTPVDTLTRARETALALGIRYAYVGNVPGHPGNHTYCPKCGKAVIRRDSMFVTEMHVRDGKCAFCATPIAGVWS
jgi:pyruvate formate lyase activating enzyme